MLESIREKFEGGSTISNNDSCPLCDAGESAHRMDYETRDIWCTACESEWEFTGEKTGPENWREYELTTCPEQPERVGNKRSGFEWSQMTNDMGTDGVYERDTTPLFDIDEDANPGLTFSLGVALTGFSFPVMGTGILLPVGLLMLIAGPLFCIWGVIQFLCKPREDVDG